MIFLPFAVFINKNHITTNVLLAIPMFFVIIWYFILTFLSSSRFEAYFLLQTYDSKGVLIRVLMNILPTIILFYCRERFKKFSDYRLWQMIGIASIMTLFTVYPLSTVTDRFALYLSPIQITVYSRLPVILRDKQLVTLVVVGVAILYSAVLFIWLNYAFHSHSWLPYSTVFNANNIN